MIYLACLLITLVSVPLMMKVATRMGIVDRPDGVLKTHTRTVPYLGGLGMFFGMIPFLWRDSFSLMILSISLSLGLLDDILSVNPKIRLLVEFALAWFISWRFLGFGIYQIVFTVGIVALINAVNMVDGMDGMAAGSVAISSIFLAMMAENQFARDLSITILVVSLGFLVYNFPPAKIFMGDAGSYLLGTSLSIVLASSMRYGFSTSSLRFLFPVWIYLLDLTAGFLRRILNHRSPFSGDREHFYDKLKRIFKSDVKALFASYAVVFAFSMVSLVENFYLALSIEIAMSVFLVFSLKLLRYEA